MRTFQNLSIKTKLIGMVTLAASVALVVACSAFVAYELNTYRMTAASELTTIAQMIAGTSTAALAFDDPAAALETLNTLRGEQHLVEGCIYRRDGVPLAQYSRDGSDAHIPARPLFEGYRFAGDRLMLFRSVRLDGDRVGTVYLQSDLKEMSARIRQYIYIVGAVLLMSVLAAGLVSSLLQRVISQPILHLAAAADQVSQDNNYTVRVKKRAGDEIGLLVDRFNEMMEQIQGRDVALQAARDELEDRVLERTRQLQIEIGERKNIERDLIAAKESAEASSTAKSAFLANMSHELRTPLNAIIGYSEMLEEDADSLGQPGFIPDLRRINLAGKHLLSLINDVLDLSKIEAGRVDLHFETFSVVQVLDDVASTTEPLVRQNGNRLLVECEEPQAIMSADPLKFRQSLLNLLSNACKFTENGTITLAVRRRALSGQDWFDWEVSDTGIGIAPEQMNKLFQSFTQVDNSSTRKHGGTGLGLAISQRLCTMMGGTILVESRAGIGSKFTIRLPAEAGNRMGAVASRPAGSEASLAGGGARSVLVIDDDPAVRDLLERSLGKHGFRVEAAANGRDGLSRARESRPSAIILDILLPDIDGWEVFREIQSDPVLGGTPVLIHTISEARPPGLTLAKERILQKPVPVERIIAVLRGSAEGRNAVRTGTM